MSQEKTDAQLLIEALELNNVKKINTFEELNVLYNVQKLKDTNEFESSGENNIIIFDTEFYNSCYVLDLYNNYITDNKKSILSKCNIYYCDNLEIFLKLFESFFNQMNLELKEGVIRPVILYMDNKDINIELETLVPINLETFKIIDTYFLESNK